MNLDGIVRTIDRAFTAAGLDARADLPRSLLQTIRQSLGAGAAPAAPAPTAAPAQARDGAFATHRYSGPGGQRDYKLYVPRAHQAGRPLPLLVMLHGCRQDPDDFARGTRMNEVAEEHGLIVAWPAQSPQANGSNCWRWYEAREQVRGGSEPSILAGIVAQVAKTHRVDARRTYVAGLSAGASMAVILGQAYPDLFAAVAAHSGLAQGAAHDVGSAFAAMREGHAGARVRHALPTLVLHGEADATVAPANGTAIVQRALAGFEAVRGPLRHERQEHAVQGRRCTVTRWLDDAGLPLVQHCSVQGGGHQWFGGSRAGSFAGPEGPDASRDIVRFLLLHTLRRIQVP